MARHTHAFLPPRGNDAPQGTAGAWSLTPAGRGQRPQQVLHPLGWGHQAALRAMIRAPSHPRTVPGPGTPPRGCGWLPHTPRVTALLHGQVGCGGWGCHPRVGNPIDDRGYESWGAMEVPPQAVLGGGTDTAPHLIDEETKARDRRGTRSLRAPVVGPGLHPAPPSWSDLRRESS